MEQQDVFSALPGVAGGRQLLASRGPEYFAQIGARGGQATRDRHGLAHLRELARRGGRAKRHKLYTLPATIEAWDGITYRRVPYWPHQPGRRRRQRPVFVRIEQGGNQA